MCIVVEAITQENIEGRENNPIHYLLFAPILRDPFFNFFFLFFGEGRIT